MNRSTTLFAPIGTTLSQILAGSLLVGPLLIGALLIIPGPSIAQAQPARGQSTSRSRRAPPRRTPNEAALAFAQQLGDVFATVAEQSSPSVVSIRVQAVQRSRFGTQSVRGGGSGVIFRANGHILTNHHVVGTASAIEVRLYDGRVFPARIVGTDPATDLAVIRIDADGLPAARFAARDSIRVGEWVVAVGSPFGLDYTVTAGIVSALGRGVGMNEIEDYVQTDASINPGNSGGPLVNLRGEVVGINTMVVGRGSGIGFAVVSELAERVARQIIDGGHVRRAYIGVSFQALTPSLAHQVGAPPRTQGALVAGIDPDGPAAESGLRPGDIIVGIDDVPLQENGALFRRVLASPVGSSLRLEVLRERRRLQVVLTTAERPGHPVEARAETGPYGLAMDVVRGGVRVTAVEPGSAASRAGLMPGDIIVDADRRHVGTARAVRASLADGESLLRVRRGRGALYVSIRVEGQSPAADDGPSSNGIRPGVRPRVRPRGRVQPRRQTGASTDRRRPRRGR